MSAEHDKLREAIETARARARHYPDRARFLIPLADAAESTLPKTKMVEVWHVEYCTSGSPSVAVRWTKKSAENTANSAKDCGDTCIRVTGPHSQEVPA